MPRGPYPDRIVAETEEDIAGFIEVLRGQGVVVRQPEPMPLDERCQTPYWSVEYPLVLLRPGLALVNPSRVNEKNLPQPLRRWDIIRAPELASVTYSDFPP